MTEQENKQSAIGLGIVLRAFQYCLDDHLELNGIEPKACQFTPEEIYRFFRLAALSDDYTKLFMIAKHIRPDLFPTANIGKMAKYKDAYRAAYMYASHYKSCFEGQEETPVAQAN